MPIQIDLGTRSNSESEKTRASTGPVVGIDLGTTNSLVAFADKNGKPHVLKNREGQSLVPSIVAFGPNGKVEVVGMAARELRTKRPGDVLFSVKRLMGRSLADLGEERHQIPFELVDDALHSQLQIKVGEKILSPVEISAEILRNLKSLAENSLGQKVERAVITVPAYFDDAQRTATKAAGRLAGLEVLRVFNEPTAAALAYGWSHENPGRVAVYDLGGGTFDLSVLRIEENVYEVLSTAGDTHLGGDDFDVALAKIAFHKLNLQMGEPGTELWTKIWAEALPEAERVKIELSQKDSSSFSLNGKTIPISRVEAEEVWKPLIERSLALCARALSDAKVDASELNDVILVGGATRLPLVRSEVERFFKRRPNTSLNPDEAVALGAALQAEVLAGNNSERLLLDVVPLSLGIETMGGVVSKLIARNSTIPTESREVYTNHAEKQTAFDIHVLQGERELVKDARSLARFRLRGLDPAPPGFHRIEVLFRIDANGILSVRAKDLRSGKAHEIEVRPSFGISEDDLVKMLEDSEERAEEDMQNRQLIDLRLDAETTLRATEKVLATSSGLIDPQEVAEIKARVVDLKNAMNSSSLDSIHAALTRLDEASRELAELQVNAVLKSALSGQNVSKV